MKCCVWRKRENVRGNAWQQCRNTPCFRFPSLLPPTSLNQQLQQLYISGQNWKDKARQDSRCNSPWRAAKQLVETRSRWSIQPTLNWYYTLQVPPDVTPRSREFDTKAAVQNSARRAGIRCFRGRKVAEDVALTGQKRSCLFSSSVFFFLFFHSLFRRGTVAARVKHVCVPRISRPLRMNAPRRHLYEQQKHEQLDELTQGRCDMFARHEKKTEIAPESGLQRVLRIPIDYRCEDRRKVSKLASSEAILVHWFDWYFLFQKTPSNTPKNEPFSQEMHLKIPLQSRDLKLSNSKPSCRVSALHSCVK